MQTHTTLRTLTDQELAEAWNAGGVDLAALEAECSRRDRETAGRASQRQQHAEWFDMAYAQYRAAEAFCKGDGNMLSEAGRATGRGAFPMLWEGTRETADKLASDDLICFWDYQQARIPGPGEIRAGRAAATRALEREYEHEAAEVPAYQAEPFKQRRDALRERQAATIPASVAGDYKRHLEQVRAQHAAMVGTIAKREPRTVEAPTGRFVQPAPIDGARVLEQCYGYLGYMGHWPSQWAQVTATLYAAASHATGDDGLPVWQYMPRLFFTSREGGSGKSWLARQVAALCPDPKSLVEMTKASLVDLIAQHSTPTITEFDVAVGTGRRMQWLTGIANAGYEPDHMTSRKHGGKVQEISLFGPMILDGLDSVIHATGEHLKTLMSRCVIVHVQRAPEGYRAPRFDREKRAIAGALQGRLARWMGQAAADGIGDIVPAVPEGLGNRPAALWEPLFAVADAAGGDRWPELARAACERIESATGLPDQDDRDAIMIDGKLDEWGASVPEWPGEE